MYDNILHLLKDAIVKTYILLRVRKFLLVLMLNGIFHDSFWQRNYYGVSFFI